MSEPWGTTGRVTLETIYGGRLTDIRLDRDIALGHYYPNDRYAWSARGWCFSGEMPSRDAAVMWVLRRTAPDVWRAERPVVWRACPAAYLDVPVNVRAADMHARAEYARAAR